jgi:hypothetical protein
MRYGAVVFDADMAAWLILEALPSFESRAKASCLASPDSSRSSFCLASRQVGLVPVHPSCVCRAPPAK